jgi:glycerophosphoryl diester phosphodiesterase
MHHMNPTIVAHRGWHAGHPENSLGAFRAAWDAGFTWCECDVWETAAGEIIVLHDETLERTSTGSGSVRALKFDGERRSLRLRLPDGRVTEEPLPSLADARAAMSRDARLLVEVKPANSAILMQEAIEAVGSDGAVQSFDLANVQHALAHQEVCPVLWLIDHATQLDEVRRVPCSGIGADHSLLDAESVAFLRRMNKKIAAWTVNEETDILRMLALGVDVIITDEPMLARRLATRDNPPKIG